MDDGALLARLWDGFGRLQALLGAALPASAQNQAALEKAFEGREVVVLMDMPASHTGVDLYLQREEKVAALRRALSAGR